MNSLFQAIFIWIMIIFRLLFPLFLSSLLKTKVGYRFYWDILFNLCDALSSNSQSFTQIISFWLIFSLSYVWLILSSPLSYSFNFIFVYSYYIFLLFDSVHGCCLTSSFALSGSILWFQDCNRRSCLSSVILCL